MTAPMPHPAWCDREHGEMPLHSGQVGVDLDLSESLSYAIYLQQQPGEPATVQLLQHTPDETTVTGFSILEASVLRDLLGEGLGLLAREAGLR